MKENINVELNYYKFLHMKFAISQKHLYIYFSINHQFIFCKENIIMVK